MKLARVVLMAAVPALASLLPLHGRMVLTAVPFRCPQCLHTIGWDVGCSSLMSPLPILTCSMLATGHAVWWH